MCPTYRCPIDDVVFQTSKIDRAPTLKGHPECTGPECQKDRAAKFGAGNASPVVSSDAPASAAATPALQPPPAGQGW